MLYMFFCFYGVLLFIPRSVLVCFSFGGCLVCTCVACSVAVSVLGVWCSVVLFPASCLFLFWFSFRFV